MKNHDLTTIIILITTGGPGPPTSTYKLSQYLFSA